MNQIYAYLFIFSVLLSAIVPMIAYIRNKYYYIDTTPIHYWLNKKNKIKKRYKSFKRRNKKFLKPAKISRIYKYASKSRI
jgi:hypothetical protein